MTIGIDLAGKTALVTGGSRGLGAEMCRTLAKAGAAVAVHYAQNRAGAEAVAQSLRDGGARAAVVHGDFHVQSEVEHAVADAVRQLGPIDILVNNVGREEELGPALSLDWSAYAGIIELNLRSAYCTSRAVVPHMQEQRWGRIINILSMAAHQYPKGMSPYSAAKNALRSFTQSLAVELGPDNITVNAVSPGWIPVERHGPASLPGRMATAARTPLGHLGTAADVAGAVLYFASDLANFITGVEIPVCGGVHLL